MLLARDEPFSQLPETNHFHKRQQSVPAQIASSMLFSYALLTGSNHDPF